MRLLVQRSQLSHEAVDVDHDERQPHPQVIKLQMADVVTAAAVSLTLEDLTLMTSPDFDSRPGWWSCRTRCSYGPSTARSATTVRTCGVPWRSCLCLRQRPVAPRPWTMMGSPACGAGVELPRLPWPGPARLVPRLCHLHPHLGISAAAAAGQQDTLLPVPDVTQERCLFAGTARLLTGRSR